MATYPYLINGKKLEKDDPRFQEELKIAHAEKRRPLCLCVEPRPGIPMYIARIQTDSYLVKRMPNSGKDHDQDCDSFETPAGLSGRGEVMGQAIKEDPDEETTTLRFDFSLSKGARRAPPAGSGEEKDSVKTDGKKLTLLSTLHYLWEEAQFNRWSPAMAGKRNWGVIRYHLLQAAQNKLAKGINLANLLYIPEPFFLDKKDEIAERRENRLRRRGSDGDSQKRNLMILIGQVKEFKKHGFGFQLVVKHVPDRSFNMNEDLTKRVFKRFDDVIKAWTAFETSNLMTIATFSVDANGIANIEEMALMNVTENWLPYESADEKQLIDALVAGHRRFNKTLRYNLPRTRAVASAILLDRPDRSLLAMYVVPFFTASSEEKEEERQQAYYDDLERVIEESGIDAWKWDVPNEAMPELPAS